VNRERPGVANGTDADEAKVCGHDSLPDTVQVFTIHCLTPTKTGRA